MANSSRTTALAVGGIAALTWGLTGTFIKLLPEFTTLEVLALRISIALVSALCLCLVKPRILTQAYKLVRQPLGILLASLMVLYYLFAVRAFQLAPVSDVTLVVGLSPILGLGFKATTGKPLSKGELIGAITAFVGLFLFVLPRLQGGTADRSIYIIGLFFALLAACVSLSYAALFRQQSHRQLSIDPVVVAFTTFAIGTVAVLPIAIATSPQLHMKATADLRTIAIVLGLGVVSTVLPTFCYSYAAKHLSPILTTALNLLTPIFAAAIATIFLGESLPTVSILGAILVFGGIFLISADRSA
ncbi:MAG: DMT family transporter [Cyanobacteria bacterium P01_D01_bin.1]